jgi:hypothetical protein
VKGLRQEIGNNIVETRESNGPFISGNYLKRASLRYAKNFFRTAAHLTLQELFEESKKTAPAGDCWLRKQTGCVATFTIT